MLNCLTAQFNNVEQVTSFSCCQSWSKESGPRWPMDCIQLHWIKNQHRISSNHQIALQVLLSSTCFRRKPGERPTAFATACALWKLPRPKLIRKNRQFLKLVWNGSYHDLSNTLCPSAEVSHSKRGTVTSPWKGSRSGRLEHYRAMHLRWRLAQCLLLEPPGKSDASQSRALGNLTWQFTDFNLPLCISLHISAQKLLNGSTKTLHDWVSCTNPGGLSEGLQRHSRPAIWWKEIEPANRYALLVLLAKPFHIISLTESNIRV